MTGDAQNPRAIGPPPDPEAGGGATEAGADGSASAGTTPSPAACAAPADPSPAPPEGSFPSHGPTADPGASTAQPGGALIAGKAARPGDGLIRQYELVELVKAYDPHADEDLLNRAYVFAMKAHGGQTRKSGDPYFSHPLAVAAILTELKADPASVATALLHDVVEDTDVSVADIEARFGAEIARLVDGVTKLSQIELRSPETKQAENFRKLVVAMADDVRVLLVKLADRLHNMRTLGHHSKAESRRRIALETLDIYAPLAGRIGVHRIREELEDLAFAELNPDAFATICTRLDALQGAIGAEIAKLGAYLRDRLANAGVVAEVYSREKRPYSIFRKMAAKNVPFEDLADIYAFRILTNSVVDCYRALCVIHTGWRMIPEEFDDYISATKPNGYRSIHTAVIGPPRPDGGRQRIEVQIRTREMHEAAERGVAAHWQYKDPGARSGFEITSTIAYDPYETPRRLVDMFQMGEDPEEALAYAKLELFQDQVFVFTPKGEVVALPSGATPLDFAYAVHTDVGDSCVGAKINGVQRPLRTALRNGDVVTVLRSANAPPPPEWERIAVTGRARAAIRRRIKKMQFDEQVSIGRQIAEDVFQGAQLAFSGKALRAALRRLALPSVDEVLARVGRGELSVNALVDAVYPGASLDAEGEIRAAAAKAFKPRFAIEGLPARAPVRMGACCTPVPGERIVGIRAAADGVVDPHGEIIVHTIYCPTLERDDPEQSRWVDLRWRTDHEDAVVALTRIVVSVRNEIGVLSDVAGVIARYGVSIANIRLEPGARDFVTLAIDIEVKDTRQLQQMLAGLRATPSVLSADRSEATGDPAPAGGGTP